MADPVVAGATNGVSSGAARTALLAEMPFRDAGDTKATEAKVEAKAETKAEPKAVDPDVEADETEAASDEGDAEPVKAAEPDADADDDEDKDAEPDAETKRRLGLVERAEKRARQQLKADREAYEMERREHLAERKAFQAERERFEAVKKRAKYDFLSVVKELGLSDDDYEPLAQQLYAHSKAGLADPKRRAAVEANIRAREQADELARMRAQIEELTTSQKQARAQAEQAAAVDQYIGEVTKAVDAAKAPLVARHLEKSPKKAKAMIQAIASELLEATDEVPDHADVIAEYEKRRRAQLEEDGVDIDALLGRTASATTTEAKKPKTLGSNLTTTTKPKAKAAREDVDAEILKEISRPDFRLD